MERLQGEKGKIQEDENGVSDGDKVWLQCKNMHSGSSLTGQELVKSNVSDYDMCRLNSKNLSAGVDITTPESCFATDTLVIHKSA